MMTSLRPRLVQQQNQALSPRLQEQVRLLQLSSMEFMQELHAMLDVNPFLEAAEPDPPDVSGDDLEHETWQDLRGTGSQASAGDGDDLDLLSLIPSRTTLAEHLLQQLNVMSIDPRELALAQAIVGSLDDDGRLSTPLDEIAACAGLSPPASWSESRIALRLVQSLDPAGVAAQSLQECLLLQTRDIDDAVVRRLACDIIELHLEALASTRDPAPLARLLERPSADVQRACDRIRRMDPRPGWRFNGEAVQYITPDVIVRKVRGRWTTVLNPAVMPRVCLNQRYANLFERHRGRDDSALAGQLRDARWAVRSMQQRFQTILHVAQAIVRRQTGFLDYGEMALRPMSLRDVAAEVGIHESTVSRVTNNKYMATQHGVFELKHFFSRAMTSASGGEYSGKAVRELVSEMIRDEPPGAPLSDAEIARRLERQGFSLCRRTVTNYRRELRIPSTQRRLKVPGALPLAGSAA
jgi:RNA polymerase sigma-54 factor